MPRPRRRLTELMYKTVCGEPKKEDAARWAEAEREWHLTFLRSPLEFLANEDATRVAGIRLGINKLEVNSLKGKLAFQ